MSLLGYAYLHAHSRLTAFEPTTQANRDAVMRLTVTGNTLQVLGKSVLLPHPKANACN